jgi:hypothetical protein
MSERFNAEGTPVWLVAESVEYEGWDDETETPVVGPHLGVRVVAQEHKWGAVDLSDDEAIDLATEILSAVRAPSRRKETA